METLITGVLNQPTLQDNVKSAFITKLLKGAATLAHSDAVVLLDLGVDLKSNAQSVFEAQIGDRILLALSMAHRDLFWTRFNNDWFKDVISHTITDGHYTKSIPLMISVARKKEATAPTEEMKQDLSMDMTTLQSFAERQCISAAVSLAYPIQCLFISMFIALPDTRPVAKGTYIEFLVDHLAIMPVVSSPTPQGDPQRSKPAINLLQQCWENGPDDVYITMPHLFLKLSDDEFECSIGIGHLLQAVPANYTVVVDPFIQNLDSTVLWRLKFTVQRLINWLVTIDMPGIGIWIVAIMESLASRGEFMVLRELTDENAYKIARQLGFRARRDDALLVLRFMLLGYHHSPILFHNIFAGFIPLLVSCRKTPEDIAFATGVSNLAQILVFHFGDSGDVGSKVQKARTFLELPVVSRAEALGTMQDYAWKKTVHIQNTSAGFRRKTALAQPLGKVGLVNLGNSCFMNSALRALFCSTDFKQAIMNDTSKVDVSKVMTTRLRETFTSLSTPRLSIFTPSALYKALPDWLNDGHQQDAAEFTKILFSQLEDEDPISKRALGSFHGTAINQIKCSNCGTVSSTKEEFYDLAVPVPHSDAVDLQALVDVFPSVEELNQENKNEYFCDQCQSLQAAKRHTMLASLPSNLIVSLNRFEFDVKSSRRIKINTPILLTESIQIRVQDSHEFQMYDLYAVVIHTGASANHGHYYTYARDSTAATALPEKEGQAQGHALDPTRTWLLYNDTSITMSSFEAMQQTLSKSRTETPYMLFFKKSSSVNTVLRAKRSISNL